ncbi:MAG TPA: hypothetical protein IGS53_13465 [Leptolyngbyaceae cyanobacterium M33_DOE_097]|uniref:Uncharacterized protein n=1 Tax=Oscillatoriales cyanobacterium SpSt-418 TaxID=2282169 RepID=A0A7C3PDV3_9CYAN|nr:hypothetical protein [Leptolyngbyaceae cyanobacterium M33_DOE_097]
MGQYLSLNELWRSVSASGSVFRPEQYASLSPLAQRYLNHTIAPDTSLATAVRLRMHGEIKLKTWLPFQAEQVLSARRGMIWRATTWMNGLPIIGWDRLLDGEGAMQWKLLGLLPVVTANGRDVTRSGIGRMQGECIWLPSVFCDRAVQWADTDDAHTCVKLTRLGETTDLHFTVDNSGRLEQLRFQRWGNPEGAEHHYVDFGGYFDREGTFSGYTIPTQMRIGWYFGSEKFDAEGEFFRAVVDEVVYR